MLRFEYHYAVLPRGLIPRFIVRTRHLLSERRTVWRAGAVLEAEDSRILVRGDIRTGKVFIQVQGEQKNRRRALAIVRDIFKSVHHSYGEILAEAKVPLPLDPDAPPVDYNYLLKLERQNVGEYYFEKADKAYNIRELLDGIDDKQFDVFLSHNSKDKIKIRELYASLSRIGVRCWLDEEHLTPGESWQKEIAYALDNCLAILVVIGEEGAGSWQREEFQVALDYAVRSKKKVIPVLIEGSISIHELPLEYSFLKNRTAVDCRNGYSEKDLHRIARAVSSSK